MPDFKLKRCKNYDYVNKLTSPVLTIQNYTAKLFEQHYVSEYNSNTIHNTQTRANTSRVELGIYEYLQGDTFSTVNKKVYEGVI